MVVVEKGSSGFGAFVPDLPGCIAVGKLQSEVISLIGEAIQFHLEDLKIIGDSVPLPASKSIFVDVPISA